MSRRWAGRRIATGLLAVVLSPVLAAGLSILPGFPGAQVEGAPLPLVELVGVPANPLIGQDVAFDISFRNTSPTETGYGPYIDLNLPLGADGNDGLTIDPSGAITYLGSPVTYTIFTAAGNCITHPYAVLASGAARQMCGLVNGSSYVVIRLPFGSFTPGQPDAVVHVTTHLSDLADAGTPETITALGGYQFGATPLNDYATDPSIVGDTPSIAGISPTVIEVTKTSDALEAETATGPNFPHKYTVTVTVAPGQTVTDLTITDALPNNIQYLFTDAPGKAFKSITEPSASTPGGSLVINFGSVLGTGGNDATATFHFYVPRVDSAAAAVLPADTGAFADSPNSVTASGSWQPVDVRDSLTVVGAVSNPPTPLEDKSIAVQKTVAIHDDQGPAGANPGDTLEWTINIQVSDYFALDSIVVDDLLGDGTHFDNTFTPTLSVNGNGLTSTGDFAPANYTALPVDLAKGTTSISFRLSDELIARSFDGKLLGGCIDPAGIAVPSCGEHNTGGTTAQIIFRSVVQQTYDKTGKNGAEVVEGDTLHNDAAATGIVLNTGDLTETGNHIGDGGSGATPAGTSAGITIKRGIFEKSIYAIDGSTTFTSPVHIAPGHTVTYRLQQGFPTSRTDDFRITDYLPLPIFDAAAVAFDQVSGATAPAAGRAKYGPSDTFHLNCNPVSLPDGCPDAPPPVVTFDTTANSVTFTYGNYALYNPHDSRADILFTVTVSTSPFADGLLLTNQAQSQTRNAAGDPETADAIVQITLDQPVLVIKKGVVGTDNAAGVLAPATRGPVAFAAVGAPPSVSCPGFTGSVTSTGLGTNPVDSNLAGVDAGDYVRFAIVVENTGHAAAYQVRIEDTKPDGFSVPGSGLQMCVSSGVGGVGSDIGYTNYLGGTGLFDKGIELNDGAGGALADGVDADGVANPTGSNIVVITYTLQLDTAVVPSSTITNTATLINYDNDAVVSASHDHLSASLTDDATVALAAPVAAKAMSGTNQSITSGSNVAIGEIATYAITLTVPEGTLPGTTVVDTLPDGLVPMKTGCSTLASEGVTSSTLTLGDACVMGTNPAVDLQVVTFDLGTVTNSNSSNGTAETITLTYNVVVTNVSTNKYNPTTALQNGAVLTWTGGSLPAVHSGNLTVVEPGITTSKNSDKPTGDAGDTIKYTVSITVASGTNREDAADVEIKDPIPTNMTYVPASLTQTAGTAPTSATVVAGLVTIDWTGAGNLLAQGAVETFTFQVTIDTAAVPGTDFANTATTTWSSLPGNWTTAQSTYSGVSTERTGLASDPGGGTINTYHSVSTRHVTIPKATVAKSVLATDQPTTTGDNVAIGEKVTYQLVLAIPEGTMPAARLVDTLPAGMAFVKCDSIAGSSTDVQGTYANACNAPTNPTVGPGGQVVTYTLGTITNVNTDNGTGETITLTYEAVVLNVATNKYDSGATLKNAAALTWTGYAATVVQGPPLTVVEPRMTLGKSPSPSIGDAGDTITFTIDVANPAGTNNTDAFDVVWTDSIPAGLTYVPGSLLCTGGACPTLHANLAPTLSGNWVHYVLGDTTTITYQATLNGNVPSGSSYINTADLTWTSLPGATVTDLSNYNATSRERTGNTLDPGGAANTYDQTAHATVTVPQPSPVKTLVSTSEAGTATTHVAVGEIVRYRIATIIPEGVTPSLNLKDALPAGLSYFKDATATVAFVANDGGIASTAFSGAGLQVIGNEFWNGDPTFPMPLAQISGAQLADGVGPTFDFGTITNSDSDPDHEMVVVEFNVLVDNVSESKAAAALTDSATIYSSATALADAGSATLTVAEPNVILTKTITTTAHDGGDTVVYHVAITNGSGADASPAYDVQFVDSLNGALTLGGVAVSDLTGVTNSSNYTTSVVSLKFLVLAPGETRTVDITATVADAVVAGTTIPNTAAATWTSLPGAAGTTPNDTGSTTPTGAGTSTGERDGSGGINSYSTSADAPVTLDAPSIAKLAPPDPSLPVGGTTTFDLVVRLPEGTTKGLVVTDTLPAGLDPMGASAILTGTSGTSLTADYSGTAPSCTEIAPPVDKGGAWTFTCGDIYLAPDGNSTNNSFVIRIHVRVANVAVNVSGWQLVNSAGLTYTDPALGTTPVAAPLSRTITVLEPKLTVTKNVASSTPHYGETVTYTLTVSHTVASNSTAYNVTVTDKLPSGMALQTGTLTYTGGLAADSKTAVGDTITLTFSAIGTLSTSTYTYQAVIMGAGTPGLNPGSTLTNNAVATWTSMPGAVYERTGNPADPGAGLNNYTIPGSASLTIGGADMRLVKTHAGSGTAGSTITWTLTYHNDGNQNATGVTLAETVPVGTTYTGSGWTCASGTGAGKPCTRNIGTVNAGAQSSVTFVVTVVDPIPTTLTTISNTAVVADDGTHGADPTLPNNTATDSVTPPIANLSLTKTVDDNTPDANQVVTFTIRVSNAGPAAATGVKVADILPAGLTYSATTSATRGSYDSGTGVWTVGNIANGGSWTLSLRATVTASAPVTNDAEVSHSDQRDSNSTPGNRTIVHEDDDASATVTPNIADLAVTKSAAPAHPDLNSNVTFTITATNNGPVSADNVVVTDNLPAGLEYKSSSASAGGYDSTSHLWTIGTLAVGNGNAVTLTLVAKVIQTGNITNTATITGGPFDPNLSNNTANAITSQLVDLEVTKTVDKPNANVGETVKFTMTVHNYGPGTANHVILHDAPPAGLTITSISPAQGSYSLATKDWTIDTIPSGATITATATGRVVGSAPMTNTIAVKSLDEPQTRIDNDSASATVTPPHTDLQLTKTVAEARPETGSKDSFTIKVTNAGPDKATGVYVLDSVVMDSLSAAFTFDTPTAWTASQGTYDTAVGRWDIGDLESGAAVTLTLFVVAIDGDYTNTATVTGDQYDPTPANNTDHADLTTRVADIDVQKAADKLAPAVGTAVTYTVTITNLGPDPATQLAIHDLLPVGLTYISNTPSAGTYDPTIGDWTIGTLAKTTPVTLTITARVVGSGKIDNTAAVSHLLQRDLVSANDQATAEINVPPAADLSLTKTVDVGAPDKGTNVTFTVTVINHGPNGTTGVHVGDLLPAGLTWISDVPSVGTYDHATGDWAIGDLAGGDVVTLSTTASVDVEGPITNTAQVTASNLPDPDSTPGNSDPGEDDQASAQINSHGLADIQVAKTVNPTALRKGQHAVYRIVATNNGPDGATGLIIRDQLPSGVTYVSSEGGTYDSTTGAWTIGSLGDGASATLTITVLVGQTGSIDNSALVAHTDQRDPLQGNDVSSAELAAAGATAPPTSVVPRPGPVGDPGSMLPWLLTLVVACIVLMSSAALTARSRRFRTLIQVSVELPRRSRRSRPPRDSRD